MIGTSVMKEFKKRFILWFWFVVTYLLDNWKKFMPCTSNKCIDKNKCLTNITVKFVKNILSKVPNKDETLSTKRSWFLYPLQLLLYRSIIEHSVKLYEMLCAIWYNLYNLKNIHGGVLLTLLKVTLIHGCFSLF